MPELKQFDPPADQDVRDFANYPQERAIFRTLWNDNVNGWTQQAILGNPWNVQYGSPQNFYYNPLETDIPPSAAPAKVAWTAFPNRIIFSFPNFSISQLWEFGDNGELSDGTPIPAIPDQAQICAGGTQTPTIPYGPYGPRGWLDEYCEWSVTRNDKGKITRIDFTCENPEYWYTLWQVNPELVCQLYQQTLDNPNIKVEDLQLSRDGQPVIDPATGRPAYNPLNKWNSGTKTTATAGGAMHLTSTPNTLQTETGLAGAATILRQVGNGDAQALLCCSDYGQPQRNSDPHIGQSANVVVAGGNKISLANPSGLYIQMPNFSSYRLPSDPNLPAGAQPSDCWQIVRGVQNLAGFDSSSNFILHATFQLPQAWIDDGVSFTVGDITIQGNPIQWASQIAQTFQVALYPLPIPTTETQTPQPCLVYLDETTTPQAQAQPLQMFHENLWEAYYGTNIPNPRNFPMNLASNSIIAAPTVFVGQTGAPMALTCATATLGQNGELPQVDFVLPGSRTPDPNIRVTVNSLEGNNYAVPGNTYPSNNQTLKIQLAVGPAAQLGQRDVRITNPGQQPGAAAPFFLWVAAGTPV